MNITAQTLNAPQQSPQLVTQHAFVLWCGDAAARAAVSKEAHRCQRHNSLSVGLTLMQDCRYSQVTLENTNTTRTVSQTVSWTFVWL